MGFKLFHLRLFPLSSWNTPVTLLEDSCSFSACSFTQGITFDKRPAEGHSGQKLPATKFCKAECSQEMHSRVLLPLPNPQAGQEPGYAVTEWSSTPEMSTVRQHKQNQEGLFTCCKCEHVPHTKCTSACHCLPASKGKSPN